MIIKKTFCALALAVGVQTANGQVNLTPEQLFPPGDTAWTLETIGLNGTLAFKLLVEHSGSGAQNSFHFDSAANGFPGSIGTSTDDMVVFSGAHVPGKIVTLPVPPNSYLSLFHDITNATGLPLSGPNGILDINDAYLNSNPVRNYTRVGADQLIKYYGANPDLSYQFTAFGQTVQLGSGFQAFIFIEEDHFPNYDYNDMIIGILPSCQKDADCNDGLFCNGVEHCQFNQVARTGGVCVGGTAPVCQDSVPCTFDECREAPNGHTCLFKPHDQDCDDGNFCNGDEVCDLVKGCLPGKPVKCDDGVDCTVDICEDKGTCIHTPDDDLCSDGAFCNGAEVCHRKKGCLPGDPPICADESECTDDSCDPVANQCKFEDNSSCDDGNACNGVERCDPVNGGCLPGTPLVCNDGITCTTDTCDPITGCVYTPDNAACSNQQFCDGAEVCDPQSGCVPGTPPHCGDSVPCTVDTCNEATDQCVHTPDPNFCSDQLHCNGVEVCDPLLGCQPGPAPNCNDSIPCTADTCDEATDQCLHAPNHEMCSNGLYCDGNEICDPVSGCLDGPDPVCNDQLACTVSSCNEVLDRCDHTPNHEACSNQLFCDGSEICDPLKGCIPGTPPECADAVTCTADSCDEATDQCLHVPNSQLCSDNVFCNGVEVCDPELGCVDGPDPVCNDGVPCTIDVCDATTDQCRYTPDHSHCIDLQFCNGVEVCDPVNGCQDGPDPVCDDGVECTVSLCNPQLNACEHVPDDSLCTDGLYCNGAEFCDLLLDCQNGPAPECDDEVSCTIDSCDEPTDSCVYTPDSTICDDGFFCNGEETCDPVNDCQQPVVAPCTKLGLICDEEGNQCLCDGQEDCDDELTCNGVETCVDGVCVPGTPPPCDEGPACMVGACDPVSNECVYTPDDTVCDDGLFCNGVETCNPETGCQPGTPVVCSDNVACTNDVCDETIDQCVYTPNNNFCLDALFCNGTEICHPTQGCLSSNPPSCGDNSACTTDTCNEATDVCDHTCEPVGITCTDQVFECDNVGDFLPPVVNSPCTPNPVATCTEEIIPGKLPQERTVRRSCSFTNNCGSSASCTQLIDIQDTTPPSVTCPDDEQVECGGDTSPGEPIVSDNCDPDPEVTVDVQTIQGDCTPNTAGISPPPKLIKLNTFTVTDGNAVVATGDTTGNSATCTQRIEIIDTRPPLFVSCPASVQGCVGQPLLFVPPQCSDVCGACTVTCTRSDGAPMGDPVVAGLTVSCVATDECENASAPCVTAVETDECSEIPTVSSWGLIILALMLMIGAKIRFTRFEFGCA